MIKAGYVLAICVIAGLIVAWYVAGRLVAPVPAKIPLPETNLPIEPISFRSDSGQRIAGWHIEHAQAQAVVLLFHGIGSNRMAMFKRAEMLYQYGYSSVLIDFQAHGESSGQHITIGHLEKWDVLATLQFAKSRYGNRPIAVIGVSMGGAAALLAASLNIDAWHIDALVIESVYPSIQAAVKNRVKRYMGFLAWLPSQLLLAQLGPRLGVNLEDLQPIDSLPQITSPMLVISGEQDLYPTKQETLAMFEQANEPKQLWLVTQLAHQGVYDNYPHAYEKKVIGFLNLALAAKVKGKSYDY